MTGSGLGRIVRAGVARRRVQTVVMTLTTLLAVTASVLAVGLVEASSAPFRHAFARQHGAELVADFDPAKVSEQQVAATARSTGVTAAAGPFETATLRPRTTSRIGTGSPDHPGVILPAGVDLQPITLAGRASPGGDLDRLDILSGRWAAKPGEMVWAADTPAPVSVGDRLTFPDAPGSPTLTVVGVARSIGDTAQAWVTPGQLTALQGPKVSTGYQMLYRFSHAATDTDMAANRAAIAAAVPTGALAGTTSYLSIQRSVEQEAATFAPFVIAFGVLGMVMSVLIIGIVVGGAVSSSTRRIGILKAIGFTPAQVTRAYVVAALIPALVGAAAGVAVGNLAAIPVLRNEGNAFGTGTGGLAPWVSVAVPIAALLIVAVAALVPALRAGRLRTVDALAVGRTPVAGRGRRVREFAGRLPLPRAISLGLGNPFARPARSATIAVAVMLGALGVTFGTGLASSLAGVQHGLNQRDGGGVTVMTGMAPTPAKPGTPPASSGAASASSGAASGSPGASSGAPGASPSATSLSGARSSGASSSATSSSGASLPGPGPVAAPSRTDLAAVRAAIGAQPGTLHYFSTMDTEVAVAGLSGSTELVAFDGDASWASYQMIDGRWFTGAGEAVVPTGFLEKAGVRVGDTVTIADNGHTATLRIVGEVLDLGNDGQSIITDAGSLAALGDGDDSPTEFHIGLAAGTNVKAYVDRLNEKLASLNAEAQVNTGEISSVVVAMDTLAGFLTLLLVTVAGLGVLNTVVLDTRERVHDLGVLKALGMAPRQTIAMVLAAVGLIGLVAGLVGVPLGVLLHHSVLPAMGTAAGTRIPGADIHVYHPSVLLPLAIGGLVIAIAGALLPAGWAARSRTARALRTE